MVREEQMTNILTRDSGDTGDTTDKRECAGAIHIILLFCSLDTGTTITAYIEATQLQPEVVRNEMTQKRSLISRDT